MYSLFYIIKQVVFEGVRRNGVQGDIALDDISTIAGACPLTGKPVWSS